VPARCALGPWLRRRGCSLEGRRWQQTSVNSAPPSAASSTATKLPLGSHPLSAHAFWYASLNDGAKAIARLRPTAAPGTLTPILHKSHSKRKKSSPCAQLARSSIAGRFGPHITPSSRWRELREIVQRPSLPDDFRDAALVKRSSSGRPDPRPGAGRRNVVRGWRGGRCRLLFCFASASKLCGGTGYNQLVCAVALRGGG